MNATQLKRIGKLVNFFAIIAPRIVAKFIFYKFSRPLMKLGFGKSQQNYLRASNQRFITISDIHNASYSWPGTGKTVLLVHGWESNSSRWESLIKLLEFNNYNIIAFDAPAHGFSEGKVATPLNYAEVIDYFVEKHKPHYIIGHSFGGFTSLYYASHYEYEFEKIIAIAPTNSVADVVEGMKNKMGFSDRCIRAFDKKFTSYYGFPPNHYRSENFVMHIKSKGLLIHDIGDKVLPVQGSRDIHKAWEGAKYVETTGLGHRTKSAEVNELILNFLIEES